MKHPFNFSVRFLVPILVCCFALISVTASYFHTKHAVLDNIEESGLRELRNNLNRAQGILEILLRDNRTPEAQRFVASFGTDLKHSKMLLVDRKGIVIASTNLASIEKKWQTILPNLQLNQPHQLRHSSGIHVFNTGHAVLGGYVGICEAAVSNTLRAPGCGFVFLEEKLDHQINSALAIVQTQAIRSSLSILVFTALVLLAIHILLTRRLNKLLSVTKQFSSGETEARVNLKGNNELARIGQSVDAMLDQIVADKAKLLKHQQQLQEEVTKRTEYLTSEIAEHKETHKQLLGATKYAEDANRAKSDFLSSMSHELRTPLNAIMGFGQLLGTDSDQPLTKQQQEYTTHILNGSKHLLELIDQVLDLAKIESGKFDIAIKPFPPEATITQAVRMASAIASQYGITVKSNLPSSRLPYIQGNETRLNQILLNLLSNAIKYNQKDGTATLTCEELSKEHMTWSTILIQPS